MEASEVNPNTLNKMTVYPETMPELESELVDLFRRYLNDATCFSICLPSGMQIDRSHLDAWYACADPETDRTPETEAQAYIAAFKSEFSEALNA